LEGDRESYAILVDKYKDMAFTLAFRMVNDRTNAEEIVQEAFVKAYTKLGSFRGEAEFSTWFYRIVYNATVSFLRSLKKTWNPDSQCVEEITDEAPGYAEIENTEFRKNAVLWAISQLKPVDRTIVTLFYHDEKSLREIGEITGMKEENVKVRLFRSRKTIKVLLLKKFQGHFEQVTQ